MLREEEGKGHKSILVAGVEGQFKVIQVSNVLDMIYFPDFLLGNIGYVLAKSLSIVQENSVLDPKPTIIIQEQVQEANTLCRKATYSEFVFIFKLLNLIAVKHV